ncbi:Protein CBG07013 [Caenorhabditis briggsae]|uniref:Protein CBG07013 n=2 Tax=Caenorhabditis briggsae TaxID=6238 RepID=A8X3X1_CAEBR|nr:Protein CBG07013 [Caenorhabditis briggsae]ULU08991.1 hypothetical protein L3Y34_019893 [Caenorhabditis briggsae]CAP27331.1 Protein CBG07013 [Caenorhabditis briggsae]
MVKLRDEQKAELIKQEKKRRRLARLRQVRQQTSINAKIIREVVSQKRAEVIEDIKASLEEQVIDMVVENGDVEIRTPRNSNRRTSTPDSMKFSRRRQMTEKDLALAQKRNADAMRRLQNSKKRKAQEQEERLAKRKDAAQKANAIMRGAQVL